VLPLPGAIFPPPLPPQFRPPNKPLIPGLSYQLVRQQLKRPIMVVDVLGADVLVGDPVLLQVCEGIHDVLDHSLYVLDGEELVGVQAGLEQVA